MRNTVARTIAGLAFAAAAASPFAAAETKANPAWEKMKTLVGAWEGREGNQPVSVTYTLVSNGTSLMESLTAAHDTNMVTMYAPDGDAVVATHYCAIGNQPRMRAPASGDPAAKKVDFQFVDATNVQNGETLMRRLVVTFQDADHFQQSWTSRSDGKDQTSEFVYARKR
ncbi:MAG TPA: hypothetical protein VGO79_05125 [Thermoanaerobaculia bacterium]|jgi:hypothetical protein